MDISAFAKVEVSGPGAADYLSLLVANRLPHNTGGIALTYMLNRRGRIELECTVVKLASDRFYLVCAAFFETRLLDHLAAQRFFAEKSLGSQIHDDDFCRVTLRSDDWAALALAGPRARAVLAACTDADLTNAGFPWLTAQRIEVAGSPVWALRMSYAGELGWELHIPRTAALAVFDALWQAGQAHGIADYGSFAMNALRMEKGFKGAGELTNEVTLPEADVMRFARSDQAYLGRAETLANTSDLPWVCAYLEVEPDGVVDGHGGEPVLLDGQVVGSTSSVAFGPTVGKILAFAYVKPHAARPGTGVQVVIHGTPRAGRILGQPAHDPASALPRTDAVPEVVT